MTLVSLKPTSAMQRLLSLSLAIAARTSSFLRAVNVELSKKNVRRSDTLCLNLKSSRNASKIFLAMLLNMHMG